MEIVEEKREIRGGGLAHTWRAMEHIFHFSLATFVPIKWEKSDTSLDGGNETRERGGEVRRKWNEERTRELSNHDMRC